MKKASGGEQSNAQLRIRAKFNMGFFFKFQFDCLCNWYSCCLNMDNYFKFRLFNVGMLIHWICKCVVISICEVELGELSRVSSI